MYNKIHKAHSKHTISFPDGSEQRRYSQYELGVISGKYRDIYAIVADEAGFDGMGFDATVGSADDNWHVINLFNDGGRYVDTVAIGGATSDDHALTIAAAQFDHMGADYGVVSALPANHQFDSLTDQGDTWSIDAISKLLNNPSQDKHYLPVITAQELATEATRVSFDSVAWDGERLLSHRGSDTRLYLDMVKADTRNELVSKFDMKAALAEVGAEVAQFDALMDTKVRLSLLQRRLYDALRRAETDKLQVVNVAITKEFKRLGMVNIAFVISLSDGQQMSIWFHNPDDTPGKILPSDIMISWKWLLNKRDVTAILSPPNGDNVQLNTLARRMMRLAEKNSDRFKRTQANREKTEAELLAAEKLVEEKQSEIEKLDSDIASLKDQIDGIKQQKQQHLEGLLSTDVDTLDTAGAFQYMTDLIAVNEHRESYGVTDTDTIKRLEEALARAKAANAPKELEDDTDEAEVVEKGLQTNSDGVRYEYEGRNSVKIYMNASNDDHWLVYAGIKPNTYTVYANNASTRTRTPNGYGMPKVFSYKEAIAKYKKFVGIIEKLVYISVAEREAENQEGAQATSAADTAEFEATKVAAAEDDEIIEGKKLLSTYIDDIKGPVLVRVYEDVQGYYLSGKGLGYDHRGNYRDAYEVVERLEHVLDQYPDMRLKNKDDIDFLGQYKGDLNRYDVTIDGENLGYAELTATPADTEKNAKHIEQMLHQRASQVLVGLEYDGWDPLDFDEGYHADDSALTNDAHVVNYRLENGTALIWYFETSDFELKDDLSRTDQEIVEAIKAAAKEPVLREAILGVDSFIESFFERNKDKITMIGMDKNNVFSDDTNSDDEPVIHAGMFEGKTLNFANTICKLADAADAIGAEIAINDFNNTEYHNSMFDGLTNLSKPVIGITAQVAKNGAMIRARVSSNGDLELLMGGSGATVFTQMKHRYHDNTDDIKAILIKALDQAAAEKQANAEPEPEATREVTPETAPEVAPKTEATDTEDNSTMNQVEAELKAFEGTVYSADWNPVTLDDAAFEALYHSVESTGNAEFMQRLEKIASHYEKRLIADAMAGMQKMTGE